MASDDLTELWDLAIYKEVASQALYSAGQKHTSDPAVIALLKELENEEIRHANILKDQKDRSPVVESSGKKEIQNLKTNEYLTATTDVDGASLQEIMVLAIEREQQSVEFYSKMLQTLTSPEAVKLCEILVPQELKHKLKLEKMYDDLYYQEN